MPHRLLIRPFLTVALVLAAGLGLGLIALPSAQAASTSVRVMPLGDSITGSPGCWRQLLWNRLQSTGHTGVDFVGSLDNSTSCGSRFDGGNEGHGGYLARDIAQQKMLVGWLDQARPDVVLVHLGTNDVWSNISTGTILGYYSTLVDQMRAANPRMKILVAQITPMAPAGCSTCTRGVVDLDNAIPAWAAGKTTSASPITVVDQFSGYVDATDTVDGVHPNSSGNQKIAGRWYPALTAAIAGSAPTATPTVTPTPTPTSAPSSAARRIRGSASGRCVDVPGYATANRTPVQLYGCTGGANQRWTPTASGELRGYGNKCLDAQGFGRTSGTKVNIWDCTGAANQHWTVTSSGTITNVNAPGLCLDAGGGTDGTPIALWTCTGRANQRWTT